EKLSKIPQIDFVHFSAKAVVRHPVVAQSINAYEQEALAADGRASCETIGEPRRKYNGEE
ncbi:phosphate starvation-inducible protein PhoH, partial [Streptococcus suis]